jgi:hypothetical protein
MISKMFPNMIKLFVVITMARTYGHGRRWEFYKSRVMILTAVLLFYDPNVTQNAPSLRWFYWNGWGNYLYIPPLLAGLLSWYGLNANIKAWPYSKIARFFGAFLGCWYWFTYAAQLYATNNYGTLGFSCCLVAVYLDIVVMMLAAANLPEPGAPGNLGYRIDA